MEELSYKDLQIKAKELGMEKVVGVSADELKSYIAEKEPKNTDLDNSDNDLQNPTITNQDDNKGENENPDEKKDEDLKIDLENNDTNINCSKDINDTDLIPLEENSKDIRVKSRGFRDYEHASNYLKSETFKKLSLPDQEELKSWFERI